MASNCIDDNSFGEPHISLRIGDEYQAELPQVIGLSDYISNSRNHMDTKAKAHSYQYFFIGLPIPLMSLKQDGPVIISDTSQTYPTNIVENVPEDKMQKCRGLLVPGLVEELWNDVDKASFNLGLYIFEKNFIELRRFVETKKTGNVMSYYYGEFYGSAEYVRWSRRRKTKGKKYVFGPAMFSRLRQQELLSRLFPTVSEECRSALLEASKTFEDDRVSLLHYVLSLKTMVGIKTLGEVIAIGKGKKDITRVALDSSRSNKAISGRQNIPIGKALDSLKTSEITELLQGDYRLSKARSNNLFWEAVWPRLLARGWHSEQPESEGYNGPKNSLVFLMPGVEKFSRTELIKGLHYFDSVTVLLGKVAKEPGLIELDSENKEEHDPNSSKNKSEENGNDFRPFYLRPRISSRTMHAVKFTVVDTSPGGKLRDLRTLPFGILNNSISVDRAEDREHDEILVEKNDKKPKFTRARKQKQGDVHCEAPIHKCRRKLAADTYQETRDRAVSSSTGPKPDNGPSCQNLPSIKSPDRDKLSSVCLSKGSPKTCDPIGDTRLLFDLNDLPQEARESGQENPLIMRDNNMEARNEVQNINPQRQSTRLRPLTAKALDAIAHGYLMANRKRRVKVTSFPEDFATRHSKRGQAETVTNECPSSASTTSQVNEAKDDVPNGRKCALASENRVSSSETDEPFSKRSIVS